MNLRSAFLTLLIISLPALSGCATVKAKKGGDGIPFYPSKPYLLVTKDIPMTPVKTVKTTTTKPDGTKIEEVTTEQPPTAPSNKSLYSFQIVYLPDLANRYGLTIQAGLGSASADFSIADGWKLTSLKSDVDSKTAENVEAFSGLIGAAASALRPMGDDPADGATLVLYEMNADAAGAITFTEVFRGTPFQQ